MKNNYLHIAMLLAFLLSLVTEKAEAGIFTRKIDSIQIVLGKNQLLLPGESFNIGVVAYGKRGNKTKTWNDEGGLFFTWKYEFEIIGGEKLSAGKIKVNPELAPARGKYISVKVWPKKQPELARKILIPLNYEVAIEFAPLTDFDKAPGCSFKGEIITRYNNGESRRTEIRRSNFSVLANRFELWGLSFEHGRFVIEPDFEKILDHQVGLTFYAEQNPELTGRYKMLLDYRHKYGLSFYGTDGSGGFSGMSGTSGSAGQCGSCGGDGQDGEPGYDGPNIGVWTDTYFDSTLSCNLLYVFIQNMDNGEEKKFLVNPDGGSLAVFSKGGDGGDGGSGGRGGDGGKGEDGRVWYETKIEKRVVKKPFTETVTKKVKKRRTTGTGEEEEYEDTETETVTVYRDVVEEYTITIRHQESGQSGGNGGRGGDGGYGGPGGWGGDIYLYFTEDAKLYSEKILAESAGGDGGSGGMAGSGGQGGMGGFGEPNGINGRSGGSGIRGYDGNDGYDGSVFYGDTEKFFFYGSELAEKNTIVNQLESR